MPKPSSTISCSVWMVRNGDALANAIIADKKYDGPTSGPLLQQMLQESSGDLDTAKSILRDRVERIGGKEALKLLPFLKQGRLLNEEEVISNAIEIDAAVMEEEGIRKGA